MATAFLAEKGKSFVSFSFFFRSFLSFFLAPTTEVEEEEEEDEEEEDEEK